MGRCSTKSAAAAAAEATKGKAVKEEVTAGRRGGPVQGSTKRKAATGRSKGAKVAVADSAAAAGGVTKKEKRAADAAAAATEDTGGDDCVHGGLTRLPEEYVDWILRQKRAEPEEDPDEYYRRMISDPDRPEIYTEEFLQEEMQLLRDMNELYKRVGDRFEKFQNWVRRQLELKGFVEVDDCYLLQRAKLRELGTQEQWGAMFRELREQGLVVEGDEEDVMNQGAEGIAVESN